ncbi:hypothetical protein CRP01_19930 [Flavilitoribacter nigricans DSM 23189 = NBRC 102662]|uniref:Uncharacterized protein n=1 Tax=Flavilitoribacter nigricans (strain ATCC 23147 / DSM 23189 / NBRC 102662 / NCIMB 1420 / SS-2) TaxID=1122177 RepID=A0A2D0NAI3_FLAN2|nr:hypothetical protein CRP01_19930 [Flavilitoribacter nigricans DSM 23189 = NBRC 102662]
MKIVRKTGRPPADAWSFRTGVGVDVRFGMPKYHCRYHGICRLDIDESDWMRRSAARCGTGKGWLMIPHAGFCLICFSRDSMTEKTIQTHFDGSFFRLENEIAFSDGLIHRIGYRVKLQAGNYRILEKEQGYSVLFRIISNLNTSTL